MKFLYQWFSKVLGGCPYGCQSTACGTPTSYLCCIDMSSLFSVDQLSNVACLILSYPHATECSLPSFFPYHIQLILSTSLVGEINHYKSFWSRPMLILFCFLKQLFSLHNLSFNGLLSFGWLNKNSVLEQLVYLVICRRVNFCKFRKIY